jgi:hypothetical protein
VLLATTTPLIAYPLHFPTPTCRFLAEAWWTCYSTGSHTWRNRSDCLLATGEPITIIPQDLRDSLDLEITPVPGWTGRTPTWMGIPCRIGRVTLWLPVLENPGQYRSFSVLVLLPQQEVVDTPPYIRIGIQFLMEYQIQVVLEGDSSGSSRLLIP